jgi:sulfite oxidase
MPGCLLLPTLQVGGDGLRQLELSLSDLKTKFKHATVTATVECAGNRRAEMKALPSPSGHEIKGLDWGVGAIGTATWGGVLLRDVLTAAGEDPRGPGGY